MYYHGWLMTIFFFVFLKSISLQHGVHSKVRVKTQPFTGEAAYASSQHEQAGLFATMEGCSATQGPLNVLRAQERSTNLSPAGGALMEPGPVSSGEEHQLESGGRRPDGASSRQLL